MSLKGKATRFPKRGRPRTVNKAPVGIHAVEHAMAIMQCVVDSEGPIGLALMSRRTGISPNKLYRYLVSLGQHGYLSQSPISGLYDLGPGVRRAGLTALNRFDEMNAINEEIQRFAADQECNVFHYVWTEMGPTLVNVALGDFRATAMLRVGSVLPISRSASGRVFLAYMPKGLTAPLLEKERIAASRAGFATPSDEKLAREIETIRSSLVYMANETIMPEIGFCLVSAMLGADGKLFSALTAIPPMAMDDIALRDAFAVKYEIFIRDLSRKIFGHRDQTPVLAKHKSVARR